MAIAIYFHQGWLLGPPVTNPEALTQIFWTKKRSKAIPLTPAVWEQNFKIAWVENFIWLVVENMLVKLEIFPK